jgi:type VI secretion system protein ImpG
MSDELLAYYNKELQFLRRQGAAFAQQHAKVASRLRIDQDVIEDPHVERLIEAVAFLNARIRNKLDDDFPELAEAILSVAFPQYLAPVPSMALAECRLQRSQGELVDGFEIPAGTGIDTDPIQGEGEPVRFRTTYPVTLWPMEITAAEIRHLPLEGPTQIQGRKAQSALAFTLETFLPAVGIQQISARTLRLLISGQAPYKYSLHELILRGGIGVTVRVPGQREWKTFPPSVLRPVGFEPDDAVLPRHSRSFPGHSLLTEFFAFPDKFLFIDIELPEGWSQGLGPQAEFQILFDEEAPDLESFVTPETLRMGCTPIVNLFEQTAEPIRLTQAVSEYRVVPDARRQLSNEVYSINRVIATSANNQRVEFLPMYSSRHGALKPGEPEYLWHAMRRKRDASETAGTAVDPGTEVYLSLVDGAQRPSVPHDWVLKVETTCLNRDRPRLLPYGGGQPRLHFVNGGGGVATVHCITRPTRTHRPELGHGMRWRLISQLTLSGLSLRDFEEGADGLREILKLYDVVGTTQSHENIEGLKNVTASRAVGKIREEVNGRRHEFVCRGMRVDLNFDEAQFTSGGLFQFASVLESFLASYCTINSFVQTTLNTVQRGEIHRWPKRSGARALL